jgi:hypothetical protein
MTRITVWRRLFRLWVVWVVLCGLVGGFGIWQAHQSYQRNVAGLSDIRPFDRLRDDGRLLHEDESMLHIVNERGLIVAFSKEFTVGGAVAFVRQQAQEEAASDFTTQLVHTTAVTLLAALLPLAGGFVLRRVSRIFWTSDTASA